MEKTLTETKQKPKGILVIKNSNDNEFGVGI